MAELPQKVLNNDQGNRNLLVTHLFLYIFKLQFSDYNSYFSHTGISISLVQKSHHMCCVSLTKRQIKKINYDYVKTSLCPSVCPLSQRHCETLGYSSVHIDISTETPHKRYLKLQCIKVVHGLMKDGTNYIKYSTGKFKPNSKGNWYEMHWTS